MGELSADADTATSHQNHGRTSRALWISSRKQFSSRLPARNEAVAQEEVGNPSFTLENINIRKKSAEKPPRSQSEVNLSHVWRRGSSGTQSCLNGPRSRATSMRQPATARKTTIYCPSENSTEGRPATKMMMATGPRNLSRVQKSFRNRECSVLASPATTIPPFAPVRWGNV